MRGFAIRGSGRAQFRRFWPLNGAVFRGTAMSTKTLPIVFLALLSTAAVAETNAQCTMETATSSVMIDAAQKRGQFATAMSPILNELQKITYKATKPGIPIGDQLNAKDSARFAEVNTRLRTIRMSSYVESGLDRDARVVQTMYDTAWQIYGNPKFSPSEKDFAAILLYAIRVMFPDMSDKNSTSETGCSIETVLTSEIDKAAGRINRSGQLISSLTPTLDMLRRKYGVAPQAQFDETKMKPEDARELHRVLTQLQPASRDRELIENMQHILEWWRTAKLIYEARRDDIRIYGGSVDDMGKTLDEKLASAPERTKKFVYLWNTTNEKIPSEAAKESELIAQVAAQADKK
jgi:hypothetical protein